MNKIALLHYMESLSATYYETDHLGPWLEILNIGDLNAYKNELRSQLWFLVGLKPFESFKLTFSNDRKLKEFRK